MKHQVRKMRIGRPRAQRRLLLGNLATSLILHEKIKTTQAKAKALQPLMDQLIKSAKKPDKVIAIRDVNKILHNELSAKKLIDSIGKKYESKNSGFTRIIKLGYRAGDAAPLVQIELT